MAFSVPTSEPMTTLDVTRADQMEEVAQTLASVQDLAVDVEADSMHHFRARLCFVQLGTDREIFLLDTLVPEVSPKALAPAFETVEIHNRTSLPPGMSRAPLPGVTGAAMQPFEVRTGHDGPTVLVIGDSFTADLFPPLLAGFAGRVVWVHNDLCQFDWRIVDVARADYVLLLPAERNAYCNGDRPRGFPRR